LASVSGLCVPPPAANGSSPNARYVFVPLEQSASEFWLKIGLALAITRLRAEVGIGNAKLRR
jgi:hypothetical protein